MRATELRGVEIAAPVTPYDDVVLTGEAVEFVASLHRTFQARREQLLGDRQERQRAFDGGALPDFREDTRSIREATWRVADTPPDLEDRRVEITGPPSPKMAINALNSGASV